MNDPSSKRRSAYWFTIRILDAQGRAVPLVAPPTRREWRQFSWVRRASAIKAAGEPWVTESRVASNARGIHAAAQVAWMITFGFMINAMVSTPGDFKVTSTRVAVLVTTFILTWVLYYVIEAHQRRRSREQLQAAYLGADRCPSCNSSLAAPTHDPNRHHFSRPSAVQRHVRDTTCAGCGAAWDLPGGDADPSDEPWLSEVSG